MAQRSISKEERAAQNATLKLHGYYWQKNSNAKWMLVDTQNGNVEVQEWQAWKEINSGRRAKVGPEYYYGDRPAAITWAWAITNRRQREKPVIILDTETSGLGPDAVVLEVSAVDLCGNIVFDSLINPGDAEIDPEAAQTHGIGVDMLANAPLFTDVWVELRPLLNESELVIFNSQFDIRLLRQTAARYGFDMPHIVSHCLMKQFAQFYGEIRPAAKPEIQYLPKKLDQACEHFNIPVGGHRALADAEAARQVLLAMAKEEV